MSPTHIINLSKAVNQTPVVSDVEVAIGPQFLELFSEHMYSSPNKAFEELISNSWDAGADMVYIGVSEDLKDSSAAVWVLDNGESMDVMGLQVLWRVANSQKPGKMLIGGRKPIGKFGIGKLSTYILAHELTYICKYADDKIRAVIMDYRRIGEEAKSTDSLHMNSLKLAVHELSVDDLKEVLKNIQDGDKILDLILHGIPKPKGIPEWEDEFGGILPPSQRSNGTWTLALCTALKEAGQQISSGQLSRILRSALPLGSAITIVFNDSLLLPSKTDVLIEKEWTIGRDLEITSISYKSKNGNVITRSVVQHPSLYPYVTIEGFPDQISGTVKFYQSKISGGKSEEISASNGFFINVLGRVINPQDPYFGLKDLNHGAWAKFRASVRADGLNNQIKVNREGFLESEELEAFQAFLRSLFNKVRTYANDKENIMPNAGDVLTKSWGVMPIAALNNLVSETLKGADSAPNLIDLDGVEDRNETLKRWTETASTEPGNLISNVTFEPLLPDQPMVRYEVAKRRVVINRNHPFVAEHNDSPEQQRLLRDTALVELLTEAYMIDLGINSGLVSDTLSYRDRALRLTTQVYRKSGVQIAKMLLESTNHAKGLEIIVGDALHYLGFVVVRMAKPGEPEGTATAPTTPREQDKKTSYRFTFDAKSSKDDKVQTKDLNIARLKGHRNENNCDHVLVVAPEYQNGTLQKDCAEDDITPMRARDLAKLLMLSAATGPLNLNDFRSVFTLTDPDSVHTWVEKLDADVKAAPRLSLDTILTVLHGHYTGPNAVTTSVIAERVGKLHGASHEPSRTEILSLISGLSVLVPSLIQVVGSDVYLSTSPEKIREAILTQISTIPPDYRAGIDKTLETQPHSLS